MHVSCGKINRLRLIYHGLGMVTRERWREHVVGDDFRVVGEGVIEGRGGGW